MEIVEALSSINKKRVQQLRALAARYEQQSDLAAALGWTPSYLSQLIGPNPSRPITERTARRIEAKLKLQPEMLDSDEPPPKLRDAVTGDLLENVMLTVDSCQKQVGWKLSEEKYRALVNYLYSAGAKHGDCHVDRKDVDTLLRLAR